MSNETIARMAKGALEKVDQMLRTAAEVVHELGPACDDDLRLAKLADPALRARVAVVVAERFDNQIHPLVQAGWEATGGGGDAAAEWALKQLPDDGGELLVEITTEVVRELVPLDNSAAGRGG